MATRGRGSRGPEVSKEPRGTFFNGRKGENGTAIVGGAIGIREPMAAEEIKAGKRRLLEAGMQTG